MLLKQYKQVQVEVDSKEFIEPVEPCYFFERGVRRSIKIAPIFTTWKKEKGEDEEIMHYEVTCIYLSFETKIEKFIIEKYEIEKLYYSNRDNFVKSWLNNEFDTRTKDKFEKDLLEVIEKITGHKYRT